KKHDGGLTKAEMSDFAIRLHDGIIVQVPVKIVLVTTKTSQNISYNKRQSYDRILTPMKSMRLNDFDLYRKVYKLSDKFSKMMEKVGKMWLVVAKNNGKSHSLGKLFSSSFYSPTPQEDTEELQSLIFHITGVAHAVITTAATEPVLHQFFLK